MKFILIIFMSSTVFCAPILTAHKGTWKNHIYPQNTLGALKYSFRNGFKAIEFDVLLSNDLKLVLVHDQKINKLSNCKGKIRDLKSEFISKCRVQKNALLPLTLLINKKVSRPQNYVTITTVFDYFKDKELELIWIDLKDGNIESANALIEAVKGNYSDEFIKTIVVNSTSLEVLKHIQTKLPILGRSIEGKWGAEPLSRKKHYLRGEKIRPYITHLSLNVGLRIGDEPLYLIFNREKRFRHRLLTLVNMAQESGVKIIAWTVNSKRKLNNLMKYDLDFLLTDKTSPFYQ